MTNLKPQSHNNIEEKIDYFCECCFYICSEFGIKDTINKHDVEWYFNYLSKRININSIGKNFIWNYVTYIFSQKIKIRRFNAFKMSWFTSKQSIKLWLEKSDDWYVYHGRWLLESKLKKPENESKINPRNTEETFRRKYHNLLKGFVTCLENTSLYDPESRYCRTCFKKLECREILKNNNPELYHARTKQ
jgi:hypothetical protein